MHCTCFILYIDNMSDEHKGYDIAPRKYERVEGVTVWENTYVGTVMILYLVGLLPDTG